MYKLECPTWVPEVSCCLCAMALVMCSESMRTLCRCRSCPIKELHMCVWMDYVQGSASERFSAFFVGGTPRLKQQDVAYTPGDRFRLHTTSMGVVHVEIGEHLY